MDSRVFRKARSPMALSASRLALTVALLMPPVAGPVLADAVHREELRFRPGTSSATVQGRIRGYDTAEYRLTARAGQRMTIGFQSPNGGASFLLMRPGQDEALFNSETGGDTYEGKLPADGAYVIQIGMMRAQARRGEVAEYTLRVGIDAPHAGLLRGDGPRAAALPSGGPDDGVPGKRG